MIKQLLEYANYYSTKKWHQDTFQYIRYAFYIITIITFTGIMSVDPKYLNVLEAIIQVYIAAFLMVKFNPLVKSKKDMSDFDRQIAYTAGVFLFFTSILGIALKTWTTYKLEKVQYLIHPV